MSKQRMAGFMIFFLTRNGRYALQCQPSESVPGKFDVIKLQVQKGKSWMDTETTGLTSGVEVGTAFIVEVEPKTRKLLLFAQVLKIEKITCAVAQGS